MLAHSGMLMAAGNTAVVSQEPGPTDPPTNASTYNHGDEINPLTGVQWTNGDATAHTDLGNSTSASVDPTSVFVQVSPGVTSHETNVNNTSLFWYVRHTKNSQSTVWVLAGAGF
ncbi:MAG: hypothetical protein V3S55_14920 [Nitrospiraceae bacterium]